MSETIDSTSILESIKRLLGVSPYDDGFDGEIKDLINAEFLTLKQLDVGPESGFSISGPDDVWTDYTDNTGLIDAVRQFIYLRVRLVFDPPASSVIADAINNRISELEFRLNVQAEGDAES
jgi:hypothetical protein